MRILVKSKLTQVLLFTILVLVIIYIYLAFEGFIGATLTQVAIPCNIGFWCPASAGSSKQIACPGGTYGSTSGLSTPACSGKCNAGCQCPEGSITACASPCPAGHYCLEGTGGMAVPPVVCPQGYYCPVSSSKPIACPTGVFCPEGTTGIPGS